MQCFGCLTLDHPETLPGWEEEIDLEALLVTEVIDFLAAPGIPLRLYDFGADEAFKQRSEEGRALQFRLRPDTQKVTSESRIREVAFGGERDVAFFGESEDFGQRGFEVTLNGV